MGLRFCALTGEGAAILCRRVFPHPSRRGGACPSRHSVAGGPSFHTVGVGHWPARFLFSGQFRSTHLRPCALCHGWSEPGAAVKWNRPKFCTASGPGGPEEIKPRNRILRAGTFAEEYRDNPHKRGSGGGSAGAVRRPRDTPAAFWSLCRRGQRDSPAGRNPQRRMKPIRKPAGGSETHPYSVSGGPQQEGTAGGASPSPTGWKDKRPLAEDGRITAGQDGGRV